MKKLIIALPFLLTACSKKNTAPTTPTPAFSVTAAINGVPTTFNAIITVDSSSTPGTVYIVAHADSANLTPLLEITLTGKTPVDCIRTIRLKRSVQLLEKSKLSIANVAYEVGFNNAAYFAKVFKEEFGMLPSEYIVEIRNKEKAETTI